MDVLSRDIGGAFDCFLGGADERLYRLIRSSELPVARRRLPDSVAGERARQTDGRGHVLRIGRCSRRRPVPPQTGSQAVFATILLVFWQRRREVHVRRNQLLFEQTHDRLNRVLALPEGCALQSRSQLPVLLPSSL